RIALDERIHLPRPRSQGDPGFAALEERILNRVLQKPDAQTSDSAFGADDWLDVPAHALRWSI
ncbi:MAG: hypothetical protein LBG66_06525, partial [Gallionellaceae bacterium]|nr:hypothetical protein [Gallionellaceae bacterium]